MPEQQTNLLVPALADVSCTDPALIDPLEGHVYIQFVVTIVSPRSLTSQSSVPLRAVYNYLCRGRVIEWHR